MMEAAAGAVLVLGGARSGKSLFAERLVVETGLAKHYVATGRGWDDEMTARIAAHRASRGDGWTTIEEPVALTSCLERLDRTDAVILVDCLTLWLTNLMLEEADIQQAFQALARHAGQARAKIIFVSNEVGLGIVPDNRMARQFRDHAGRLHQMMAGAAREVYFVAAGLPLKMKG